jgi:hypothetical protein
VAAAGGGGHQQQQQFGQQYLQQIGRHRAKWQPPSTPHGFWNMGFGDDNTQDTTQK